MEPRRGAARRKGMTRTSVFAACLAFLLFFSLRAEAHAIGLSSGEYAAKGSSVAGKLAFARGEIAQLVPSMDADLDGHVTAIEVANAKTTLTSKVLARVIL